LYFFVFFIHFVLLKFVFYEREKMTTKDFIMFGDALDTLMREKRVTNKGLSERLQDTFGYKISKESIAKYRNNDRTPNPVLIGYMADVLDVTTDFLLGIETKAVVTVPVIGLVSCGDKPSNFLYSVKKTAYYNGVDFNSDMYCLIANGSSMSPEIETRDEIICNPRVEPVSGDLVHYKINGENCVKVLWIDNEANIIQLIPYKITDDFKTTTIRMDDDRYDDLVMAKVVGINKITFDNRQSRLSLIGR